MPAMPGPLRFTSGSTGRPKGAVFSDDLLRPVGPVTTLHPFVRLDFEPFDPTLCLSLLQTLRCGGQRAIATSLETMMDDFKDVRPTHVAATPVFWNSVHSDYNARVMQAVRGKALTREEAEKEVGAAMRNIVGNRCRVGSVGGAPVSDTVFEFVRDVLKIDLVNTYGARECGGITCDGVVYPGIDIKLLDVPSMGYYSTCVRGGSLSPAPPSPAVLPSYAPLSRGVSSRDVPSLLPIYTQIRASPR